MQKSDGKKQSRVTLSAKKNGREKTNLPRMQSMQIKFLLRDWSWNWVKNVTKNLLSLTSISAGFQSLAGSIVSSIISTSGFLSFGVELFVLVLKMVLKTPAEMKQKTSGTKIVSPIHPGDKDRTWVAAGKCSLDSGTTSWSSTWRSALRKVKALITNARLRPCKWNGLDFIQKLFRGSFLMPDCEPGREINWTFFSRLDRQLIN